MSEQDSEDGLWARLDRAADNSDEVQRVHDYLTDDDRDLPSVEDWTTALQQVPELVVRARVPLGRDYDSLTIDYRWNHDGVEWATPDRQDLGSRASFRSALRGAADGGHLEARRSSESYFARTANHSSIEVIEDAHGAPAPAEVDGVDLKHDGCPVCGCMTFEEGPAAGRYHCDDCQTSWAGEPTDASLTAYFGPSPENLMDAGKSLPVDIDGQCRACFVNPRYDGSRYCTGCAEALLTDGGTDDDHVKCIVCGDRVPEETALHGAGKVLDDARGDVEDGDSLPVGDVFEFDDGPYCGVGCLTADTGGSA